MVFQFTATRIFIPFKPYVKEYLFSLTINCTDKKTDISCQQSVNIHQLIVVIATVNYTEKKKVEPFTVLGRARPIVRLMNVRELKNMVLGELVWCKPMRVSKRRALGAPGRRSFAGCLLGAKPNQQVAPFGFATSSMCRTPRNRPFPPLIRQEPKYDVVIKERCYKGKDNVICERENLPIDIDIGAWIGPIV